MLSASPHPCAGQTLSSAPCKLTAVQQYAAGGVWYCPVHLKKVQAAALAEAAFQKEEKRAADKERAKKHSDDPLYHRCAANARATLARCQHAGNNPVAGTEDWLCSAHFKEAQAKAARPKASEVGRNAYQQCCGNKKGDCQHPVKYIVDDHFFCHLHNPNKVVKKCMGTAKCKASGKYEVMGQNYCVAHNPEGPRCGMTNADGVRCNLAGVVPERDYGDGEERDLYCAGHARHG